MVIVEEGKSKLALHDVDTRADHAMALLKQGQL